jgi:hypothetical protein
MAQQRIPHLQLPQCPRRFRVYAATSVSGVLRFKRSAAAFSAASSMFVFNVVPGLEGSDYTWPWYKYEKALSAANQAARAIASRT